MPKPAKGEVRWRDGLAIARITLSSAGRRIECAFAPAGPPWEPPAG